MHLSSPEADGPTNRPKSPTRRMFLGATAMAIAATACNKIATILDPDQGEARPPQGDVSASQERQQQNPPQEPPVDPNRPEFLDEDSGELTGLALMLRNNDVFDRYVFNAVTGNKSHGQTLYIQRGYDFNFRDGRKFKMPYHAFVFKPFDTRSNFILPQRLGEHAANSDSLKVASLIRVATRYKADNPKDIEAVRTIIVTSFDLSFGIRLDPNHIEISKDRDGGIAAIRYTAENATKIGALTTIADGLEKDDKNPERTHPVSTRKKEYGIVDDQRNLYLPPSVMVDQGIAIPVNSLPEVRTVKYNKTFETQGIRRTVSLNLPIDNVLEEQDKLFRQGRPQRFQIDAYTLSANPGWYILDNDPLVKQLAEIITKGFKTKREKLQAILDFIHSYNYVPDAYGEAPRTPLISLISGGGDCEDSTILLVALAKAVGIDTIFVYFNEHLAPACDIDGEGTALNWGDKKYEWAETTGGNEAVVTITKYKDPYTGEVVRTEREARAWQIGEKPEQYGEPRFVSRINSEQLTPMGR